MKFQNIWDKEKMFKFPEENVDHIQKISNYKSLEPLNNTGR